MTVSSQFLNREPKTPREWEIFFRETRKKLTDSDLTVGDLETMMWAIVSTLQNQVTKQDLKELREEMHTLFLSR